VSVRWYITASHVLRLPSGSDRFEVPWGTGHLRQVGSTDTACGLPALNWPIFWGLNAEDLASGCETCQQEASASDYDGGQGVPR
jgi:hypothetical protein